MNAPVNRNLIETEAPAPAPARRPRWLFGLAAAFLILIGVLVLIVWLLRRTIAETVIDRWCSARGLTCDGDVDQLGPDGVRLEAFTIRRGTLTPFAADAIRVDLVWSGLISPRVAAITVDGPILEGRVEGGRLSFANLVYLIKSDGATSAPPRLDVRNGQIRVTTPVGLIEARADLSGTFPNAGEMHAVITPTEQKGDAGYITVRAGVIDLVAKDGVLSGTARVDADGNLDARGALAAKFEANFDVPANGQAQTRVAWSGTAKSFALNGSNVTGLASSGEATLSAFPEGGTSLIDVLQSLDLDATFDDVARGPYSARAGQLKFKGVGGAAGLTGRVDLTGANLDTPDVSARRFTAAGDAAYSAKAGLGFIGRADLGGARTSAQITAQITDSFALPSGFGAHQAEGRRAIGRALADFDLGVTASAQFSDERLKLKIDDAVTLQAASGARVSLRPHGDADGPVIDIDGAARRITGDIALQGGGLPALNLTQAQIISDKDALSLTAEAATLAPWQVGEQSLGANIRALSFASNADGVTFVADGRVRLAGPNFGVDLAPTEAALDLVANRVGQGWSVRTANKSCVTLTSEGFVFGAVTADAFTTRACPAGGVLTSGATPKGMLALDELTLPFRMKTGDGIFKLAGGALDWSGGKATTFKLTGKALDLPMTLGERTFGMVSAAPTFFMSAGDGSTKLGVSLGETDFSGTLIPAKMRAASLAFDGASLESGLAGDMTAKRVFIADNRDDPLYQEMVGDFTGRIDQDRLVATGPLALRKSRRKVADASVDIDIFKLDGRAQILTDALTFAPGELQPVMISEHLRGVFTDASGALSARVDVAIKDGKLNGTADVGVEDFSFQTQRLGRVANVDGNVHFTDVFALTTETGQIVTIGEINPGVRLQDGDLNFSLTNGKIIHVERLNFPFAGGALTLSPLDWTLGASDQQVEVTAEKLDMPTLIETLKVPDTRVTGTVSGRFPVRLKDQTVLIENARLVADAPGGKLAYTGQSIDPNAITDPSAKLAFNALRDFDFQVLEISLNGNLAGRTKVTMQLAGSNRQPIQNSPRTVLDPGQPFEFNLALDSELASLMGIAQQGNLLEYAASMVEANRKAEVSLPAVPPDLQAE